MLQARLAVLAPDGCYMINYYAPPVTRHAKWKRRVKERSQMKSIELARRDLKGGRPNNAIRDSSDRDALSTNCDERRSVTELIDRHFAVTYRCSFNQFYQTRRYYLAPDPPSATSLISRA